jgi:hypothetical protein
LFAAQKDRLATSTGNRVKRKQLWADAICGARMDVMSRDMKRVSSFFGRGEGTSPRVEEVTDDERAIALAQAARYTALDAAERITPRRVREHIALDETAPAFGDAIALIESGHFAEARSVWEAELRRNPRSASLHYNLAAVCEALGDSQRRKVALRRGEPACAEGRALRERDAVRSRGAAVELHFDGIAHDASAARHMRSPARRSSCAR